MTRDRTGSRVSYNSRLLIILFGREFKSHLARIKKKTTARVVLFLVQVKGKVLHQIGEELIRWRAILDAPYREFTYNKDQTLRRGSYTL